MKECKDCGKTYSEMGYTQEQCPACGSYNTDDKGGK
jgi:hypothetical protein